MLTLLLKGKSCYQVVSWVNISYPMVKGFTLMPAVLPSGSMVGPRTGSHLRIDPPSLEKSGLEQSIMPLNSRNLWTRISLYGSLGLYPKGKDPSQLTRGNDPSFLRLYKHSPGSTLFLHPNLPSDIILFPICCSHQLTIAQPSWGQYRCSRVSPKQLLQWVWTRRAISPCQLTWAFPFWVLS